MPPFTQPSTPPSTPPNDLTDIFSSTPPNPTSLDALHPSAGKPPSEVSDIARLRSIHVTNGYREGVAVAKEQYLQEGFDEGYAEGAAVGQRVGWIVGTLEGLMAALLGAKLGDRDEQMLSEGERVKKLAMSAREELYDVTKLFAQTEKTSDGESSSAGEVKLKTEILEKWEEVARVELQRWNIELEPLSIEGTQDKS